MLQLKYIVRFLISLVTNSSETWNYLLTAETEESKPDYMFRNFFYPLLGIMSLFVLVSSGFSMKAEDQTFSLQDGMTCMVPVLVAFFVGPFLSQMILKYVLRHWYHVTMPDKARLTLFVFYSTGYLMAVECVIALLPSIQFLMFLRFYLTYITWTASGSFIPLRESGRWVFGFVSAFVLASAPFIVKYLLQMLQG